MGPLLQRRETFNLSASRVIVYVSQPAIQAVLGNEDCLNDLSSRLHSYVNTNE